MRELIRSRSLTFKDTAHREVAILKEENAMEIVASQGCSLHEVYTEALTLGICPFRYVRNRESITVGDQLTLARSRVAIVGAGGLGGTLILLLARIGIGTLVVVDRDAFDETNLNRQALSSLEALGRSKAEEAAKVIASVNPAVQVKAFPLQIAPHNAGEILKGCDVVADALDNVQDRFVLEGSAKDLGIPLVHGAIAGFEGQLMTIFPEDTGLAFLYGDGKDMTDRSRSPEAILGVPTLTPALVATLQAMEVIKVLLHKGRPFRNCMVHVDLEAGTMNSFSFHKAD